MTHAASLIRDGSRVRFTAHGETGLVHTVITRDGDDVELCCSRGRILTRVPIELLVLVPDAKTDRCWREVDELEAM